MSADYTKVHHLLRLVALLYTGGGGNAGHLAERLGVCERTVYRYLESLETVGISHYFDEHSGSYRIMKDVFLPPLHLTSAETLALTCLAEQVAGREQVALTGAAARAVEKIRARVPDRVLREIGEMHEHVAIQLPPTGPDGGAIKDVFDCMRSAIHTRRAVRCRYESLNPATDPDETFTYKPYALSFDQRSWYAVGEHMGRGQVRRLKLNRFIHIENTDIPYGIPDDFSLEAYRGKAWRMIRGENTYRVVIHFDANMAETVGDTHWHPTQDIEDHEDGSITFRCEVDGLNEIVWWVLGYGPHAQVLEPQQLVERIAELAAAMVEQYRKTPLTPRCQSSR